MMSIEEKRSVIAQYCHTQEDCQKCPLNIPGYWESGFCITDDNEEELNEALEIIHSSLPSIVDNNIKHPAHYCYSKYEPKDVIREWDLNFNLGSAVKYIARAGRKDDAVQDLKKAVQFIQFEIDYLENLCD